jgi:hypothetical protein
MTEKTTSEVRLIEVNSTTTPRIRALEVTRVDLIEWRVEGGRVSITLPVRGRFLEGCTFEPLGYGNAAELNVQRLNHCVVENGETVRFQLDEDNEQEMEVYYTVICEDKGGWYYAHGSGPPRMIIRPR